MSKAGDRLLKSARSARAFARGEAAEGFVVHVPEDVDVKAVRRKLGLTQREFALRYGFAYDAVRDWERRRRHPDRSARVLLTVIDHRPEAVEEALMESARQRAANA